MFETFEKKFPWLADPVLTVPAVYYLAFTLFTGVVMAMFPRRFESPKMLVPLLIVLLGIWGAVACAIMQVYLKAGAFTS